jgi:hypothetical protein
MRMTTVAVAAAVGFLASAAPGQAGTVLQAIPGLVQSLGDFTPFDINALPFNPALGTLTDVSIELTGSYLPQTANDLGPFPSTTDLTTRLFVFATNGGPTINRVLGTQTGVPVVVAGPGAAGIATGVATPVDQIFDLSDLSAFETGVGGSQLLVEYGFRTSNGLSGTGGASDLTSFSGEAVLTYTYATEVPEPGTLGLAVLGLLGLGGMARRRR